MVLLVYMYISLFFSLPLSQLIWFRESWYEDLLRQLNEGLATCYQEAFDNRGDGNQLYFPNTTLSFSSFTPLLVTGTRIKPEMFQYVQKLISSFGITAEQSAMTPGVTATGGIASQEALTKRAQAAAQDPAFQRLKNQFDSDFDFK